MKNEKQIDTADSEIQRIRPSESVPRILGERGLFLFVYSILRRTRRGDYRAASHAEFQAACNADSSALTHPTPLINIQTEPRTHLSDCRPVPGPLGERISDRAGTL